MSSPAAAVPVRRGCGSREKNGCYWECGLGPGGRPVEEFLFDPPILVPEGLTVKARGMTMFERNGVWHLLDRVGLQHYPNVADFVEEVRRFGLSRRLSPNLPFEKLTADSRLFLVHDRAWVDNFALYAPWACPRSFPEHSCEHSPLPPMCIGVWWQDVEGGVLLNDASDPRRVSRAMPSFVYQAHCRREGMKYIPNYRRAIFAAFPASRLVVVRGEKHGERLAHMRKSSIPAEEVDQ
jgi:hypothetical protein